MLSEGRKRSIIYPRFGVIGESRFMDPSVIRERTRNAAAAYHRMEGLRTLRTRDDPTASQKGDIMQSAPKMNRAFIITVVLAAIYSVAFSQSALAICRECAPECRMGSDGKVTCLEKCKRIDCPGKGASTKQQQTGTKTSAPVTTHRR